MRHAHSSSDPGRTGAASRRALPLLTLVFALVFLVPLAHASPPDPIWISGSYDADDRDDAVLAASSLDGRAMPRVGLTLVWLVAGHAHASPPRCQSAAVVTETLRSAIGDGPPASIGRAPPAH